MLFWLLCNVKEYLEFSIRDIADVAYAHWPRGNVPKRMTETTLRKPSGVDVRTSWFLRHNDGVEGIAMADGLGGQRTKTLALHCSDHHEAIVDNHSAHELTDAWEKSCKEVFLSVRQAPTVTASD